MYSGTPINSAPLGFDPDQRVKADRVGRHELVELEDRRLVRRARFEQFRHFPPGEPAG